ncbi:T9SS type A sorting domain-containing protein [Pseudopedobacter beijingensis]|uniref:T9SS type A sorting domain-containing protein n=1 Tax=Pseudopedobacter beijingensis TaxID=1207056 RepID=A0ABW4I843_9SPHI
MYRRMIIAPLYTYTDYSPLKGTNYYKLVQTDNDGKTTDLGVRMVTFNLQLSILNLYPNPTTDVVITTFATGIYTQLEITDVTGKTLQRMAISITENSKTVSLGRYPAGMYLIKLKGNGQAERYKIIKK